MKIQTLYVSSLILLFSISLFSTYSIATTKKQKLILSDPTRPEKTIIRKNRNKTNTTSTRNKLNSKFSLQQTLISQFKKIAIINGKSITIGKTINGAKLIEINSNDVVLRRKGNTFKLYLTFSTDIKEVNGK